jgi:hypothetical protein
MIHVCSLVVYPIGAAGRREYVFLVLEFIQVLSYVTLGNFVTRRLTFLHISSMSH